MTIYRGPITFNPARLTFTRTDRPPRLPDGRLDLRPIRIAASRDEEGT